ncbi:hypothetical protein OEA41_003075 [Lepraria neglecta]|uniref:Uncharacterized protein n=1 Tax=Lepraria neglecta TaxID=209136 RepID=A0AAD9Z549_9LECA|nr:hypothetical protein OEA41_003075 [Lepraria neglecta]
MAPSSLKKMSGSRGRKEGNYASSDTSPSLARFTSVDLGLTLLPGSQIQKGDESESETAARHSHGKLQNTNNQGEDQAHSVEAKRRIKTTTRGLTVKQATSRHSNFKDKASSARSDSVAEHGDEKAAPPSQEQHSSIWANDDIKCDGSTAVGDTCTTEPRSNLQYNRKGDAQETRDGDDSFQPKKRRKISSERTNKISQQVVGKREEVANKTAFSGNFSEARYDKTVEHSILCEDSREKLPIYRFNDLQKGRFSEPSVRASSSAISGNMNSSKPSVPDDACEMFSLNAPQRPEHKPKYSASSPQSSYPGAGPPATNPSLSNSTIAFLPPRGLQCTRKSVPTVHHQLHDRQILALQRTSKTLPVSCFSSPDPRSKVLKDGKAVKRSWASHFPRRHQVPPVSGRASPRTPCSSVTPLLSEANNHDTEPLKDCFTPTTIHENADTVVSTLLPASLNTTTQSATGAYSPWAVRILDDSSNTTLVSPHCEASHKRSTSLPNLHSLYNPPGMNSPNAYRPAVYATPPNGEQTLDYHSSRTSPLVYQDTTFPRSQDSSPEPHNVHGSIDDSVEQASQQVRQAYGSQLSQDMSGINAAAMHHPHLPYEQTNPGSSPQLSAGQHTNANHGSTSWLMPFDEPIIRKKYRYTLAELEDVVHKVQGRQQAVLDEKDKTWVQHNHTLRLKVEQLEKENSELHDRLWHYEPHDIVQRHNYYQYSLHYTKEQLLATQNEKIKIQAHRDSLLDKLAAKPRKLEDIVGNISKAYSPAVQHDSGVGSSNSSQRVSLDLTQASPLSQYYPAHYPLAQHPQAQYQYQQPQFPPSRRSPAQDLPSPNSPAHYPPAQHSPTYYQYQHHPQPRFPQSQNSPAQYPSAHNYTAYDSQAQHLQTQYQSRLSPQGQLAPGQDLQFIADPSATTPRVKRASAMKVRNRIIQAEKESTESAPNQNVQARQVPIEQVQHQDEQVPKATPEQSSNQNVQDQEPRLEQVPNDKVQAVQEPSEQVQVEKASVKEVPNDKVQAVQAPFEQLQAQEAPAKQALNQTLQSEGGSTNQVRLDNVQIEIIDVDHSPEDNSEEIPSILEEVRASIEAEKNADKKRLDWYDGIDPGTMTTDEERKLQFGLPSAKKRTAATAFRPLVTDSSIAPRPTKVARTPGKKATKQPKQILDEAGRAEVARQKKEQAKINHKMYTDKKKAEKLLQQRDRASSTSTSSSQPRKTVHGENLPSLDEPSQSSPTQNGEDIELSPIQIGADMESSPILNAEDTPWNACLNEPVGEDVNLAALAAEFEGEFMAMDEEEEVAVTQQVAAADGSEPESEESEEE